MAGFDGCPCGCWQSAEARAMAAKVAAEHEADIARYHVEFERWCDARPGEGKFPQLPPDQETQALADAHWFEMLAIPAVRKIG